MKTWLTDDTIPVALRTISAAELQHKQFPPIRYIVPGYLTEGLTILAGKPKLGKSWLMLDIGIAVAFGGIAFGSIDVSPAMSSTAHWRIMSAGFNVGSISSSRL